MDHYTKDLVLHHISCPILFHASFAENDAGLADVGMVQVPQGLGRGLRSLLRVPPQGRTPAVSHMPTNPLSPSPCSRPLLQASVNQPATVKTPNKCQLNTWGH